MQNILALVQELTGRDISVYSDVFLQRTINQRFIETSSDNEQSYAALLKNDHSEVFHLLDNLNISYSLFFRNIIDYSIMERFILPSLFQRKGRKNSPSIRIWSAGCADGQEPYSIAMIADDYIRRQEIMNSALIFATDISENALESARAGEYYESSILNVRVKQLETYFSRSGDKYSVQESLKKHIEFSRYDLLDPLTGSPPAAIFGGFDLVICSNLMVYYKREIQELILYKIHHSLGRKCFLIVDPSEKSIVKAFAGFRLYSALGNIFVKS